MFKNVFCFFFSKGTFSKITPKELSTIHKPSRVMNFVYLLSELCCLFAWYTVCPSVPPVPEVVTLVLCQNLNVSNFCRLQQLLLLGSSCCIQEIGDVNAMKAAYLNDEQIVKAPGSGSCFFRK